MNDESDVLVCGAGMAGLCAAVTAAHAGARVLVLEKAERLGGSMRLSGGTVWTAPSMAVMERYVGGGDRERQRRLVAGIGPGLAWLAGLGVPDGLAIENEAQVGRELDPEALTERLSTAVAAAGGRIVAESAVDELRRDAHGAIRGAVTRSADGHRRTVRARAVILATGGFQGNHELLARFVGRFADRLLIRSNPCSVGDGLLAALTAGAGTSPNMSTFYGHTMPAVPADPPPAAWTSVTQYATGDAIIINERGERFFDESRSLADELASSEIIQQPNGRAFLLVDDRLYRDEPLPGRSTQPLGANFDRAVASGAPALTRDSLPDLAEAMGRWNVSTVGVMATLEAFNEAVARGGGASLPVPRRARAFGLLGPPFRVMAVRPSITFTNGGVGVDVEGRVQDRGGRPIPGLWAAGADAGGTYRDGYMGGLVLGLVQGRETGSAAARYARTLNRQPL